MKFDEFARIMQPKTKRYVSLFTIQKPTPRMKVYVNEGIRGAYTDGKDVYIGPFEDEAVEDIEYSKLRACFDAKVGHEFGHINFSDMDAFRHFINNNSAKYTPEICKFVYNAIEDGRIEFLMSCMYKGLAHKLRYLNYQMFGKQILGELDEEPLMRILNNLLIYSKTGLYQDKYDIENMDDGIFLKIIPIIDEAVLDPKKDSVYDYSLKVLELLEDYIEEEVDKQNLINNLIKQMIEDGIINPEDLKECSGEDYDGDIDENSSIRVTIKSYNKDNEESKDNENKQGGGDSEEESDEQQKDEDSDSNSEGTEGQEDTSQSNSKEENKEGKGTGDSADSTEDESSDSKEEGTDSNKDSKGEDEDSDKKDGDSGKEENGENNSDNSKDNEGSDNKEEENGENSSDNSTDDESFDNKEGENESNDSSGESKAGDDLKNNKRNRPENNSEKEQEGDTAKDGLSTREVYEILKNQAEKEALEDAEKEIQEENRKQKEEEAKQQKEDKKDNEVIQKTYQGLHRIDDRLLKNNSVAITRSNRSLSKEDLRYEDLLAGRKFGNEIERILKNKKSYNLRNQERGLLDTNMLPYVVTGISNNVFYTQNKPNERSYAISILIDGSGSMTMDEKYFYAAQTLIRIEEGLRDLVSLRIAQYTAYYSIETKVIKDFNDRKNMNYSNSYFGENSYNTFEGGNAEYVNLLLEKEIIEQRPESDKIIFILSDGLPCGTSEVSAEKTVKTVVKEIKKAGITVIPIFFGTDEHLRNAYDDYKYMYEDNIIAVSPSDITKALTRTLKMIIKK